MFTILTQYVVPSFRYAEKDLANLSKQLLKMAVERAMNAELDNHLGYEKHEAEGKNSGNSRYGYTAITLKRNFGEVDIVTSRDRNAILLMRLKKCTVQKYHMH